MQLRPSWSAMRRKRSRTQPLPSRDGRGAARSRKSGLTPPPMRSRTWSAPLSAANSTPRGAADRVPHAVATHRSEEAIEVKKIDEAKEVKEKLVALPGERDLASSSLP